jgi:hypothetical protein
MSRRRVRSSSSGGWPTALGVLFVIGLIVKFFWWIVGFLTIVAAYYVIRAVVRSSKAAALAREQANAAIVARADEQHDWVLRGDDRGIYGIDGAKLMHYIDGGVRAKMGPNRY